VRKSIIFVIIAGFGVAQLSIADFFKVFGVKPDLLLICVVFASLNFNLRWALIFSVFAGVFKDVFSANTFGLNTLLFALWSFLIVRLAREISIDDEILRAILILAAVALHNIICGLVFIYCGKFIPPGIIVRIVLIESVYTALVSPLVFRCFRPAYLRVQAI